MKKTVLFQILVASALATYLYAGGAYAEEPTDPLYTFEHSYRIIDADGNPAHSLVVTGSIPASFADQIAVYYMTVSACMSGDQKNMLRVLRPAMTPAMRDLVPQD